MSHLSERALQVERGRLDALFGPPANIVLGTIATILAIALCFYAVPDPVFPILAFAFALVGMGRVGL